MIGVGMLASVIAAAVLWLTRGGRLPQRRGRLARPLLWAAVATPFLPVFGNASAGSSPRPAASRGWSSA